MQSERDNKASVSRSRGLLDSFRGFGSRRSMFPSLFGGRDPFDDPFFNHPIGSMFESSIFGPSSVSSDTPESGRANEISVEELNSDDEGGDDIVTGDERDNCGKQSVSSKEPSVEHPDDVLDEERKSKDVTYRNGRNKVEGTQTQVRGLSFQTCRVTYGGVDGAYYTSTRTRRAGSDGVVLEEAKEADKTTGQATHRISRGLYDKFNGTGFYAIVRHYSFQPILFLETATNYDLFLYCIVQFVAVISHIFCGHSVTRKLKSDGKVDMLQTLHNLNEDELPGFEEAWTGNVGRHLPGWRHEFDMHGNTSSSTSREQSRGEAFSGVGLLPSSEHVQSSRGMESDNATKTTSDGRTKRVVRINIE
ncbi:hypothetical protein C1H46_029648 [Malus baccata]|uniref:Uncharacterized protein n=1 Tax=Malus baccata TaxID=106549 RepID=A0A540LED4_MALBA|nr:hypothetical protein C1H46_029648 [Malus baccata]